MLESFFLTFIIITAVLLFGAIEPWAFALVGIATVVVFNAWLYRTRPDIRMPGAWWQRVMMFSVAGFMAVCIFQAIPIPTDLIKALSPSTYSLLQGMMQGSLLSISVYPYETLNETAKIAVYLIVFVMAASLNGNDARRVMASLVVFGFLLAIFAIIQKATWNGRIYWFRELSSGGSPFGPFVNRNHFAGFAGMIAPLGMGLLLEGRRTGKNLLLGFFSLIVAVGLFYSLSRGGIIAFMASAGFFFVMTTLKGIHKKTLFYISLFSLGLAFYLLYLGISPVVERFASGAVSTEARLLVWGSTLGAIRDFPLMGTGLGTFRYIFPLYSPQGVESTFLYAHNDYIQLMLETGALGTLFTAMFAASMVMAVSGYLRTEKPGPVMVGLFASVLYMLVHSVFDFNLHMPSNAITFFAVLGLTVSRIKENRSLR